MTVLMPAGELVRLEIPAQPAFVGVARSVVAAVAATVEGLGDDRLEDLRVAVSEACTNAVEAHRNRDDDDRFGVRCVLGEDRFEVCIEDGAGAMDLPVPPDAGTLPSPASERGWGIQLIQALVDDVTFRRTDEGTAVDLVMRLDARAS